jgi:hypothetical protein
MNKITYDQRVQTYTNALINYGEKSQMIVALEELSECQKEICKLLRGNGNLEHLAEEVADATIMLEQLRLFFQINDQVCQKMDEKITRLDKRLKEIGR